MSQVLPPESTVHQVVVSPEQASTQNYKVPVIFMRVLVSVHVIAGVISISAGVASIYTGVIHQQNGHGIWGGVFYLLTGLCGIVVLVRMDGMSIGFFMALAILNSVSAFIVLVIAASSLDLELGSVEISAGRRVLSVLVMVLSIIELINSICSYIVCCQMLCCGRRDQKPNVMIIHTGSQNQAFVGVDGYPITVSATMENRGAQSDYERLQHTNPAVAPKPRNSQEGIYEEVTEYTPPSEGYDDVIGRPSDYLDVVASPNCSGVEGYSYVDPRTHN